MSKAGNFLKMLEGNDWYTSMSKRTWDITLKNKVLKRFEAAPEYSPEHIKKVLVNKYNYDPDIELKIHLDSPEIIRRDRENYLGRA